MTDREPSFGDLLRRPAFARYTAAQVASAFNDNAFQFYLILLYAGSVGAVSLAGALLVVPFLLFSSAAGGLADRISKGRIVAGGAWVEAALMVAAAAAMAAGGREALFVMLFLSGVQSAFFSPAKYGYLPETLPPETLSKANALVQSTTYLAILMGTAAIGFVGSERPTVAAAIFLGVTILGALAAQGVDRPAPADPRARIPLDPVSGILRTLRRIYPNRLVWHPLLASTWVWFVGALLKMVIPVLAVSSLGLAEWETGLVLTALALGIGAGSLLAGRWSGDKVELGLVPLGSIGVGIALLDLSLGARGPARAAADVFFLGLAGGLFSVPLQAIVQDRAPEAEKGEVIAAGNFLNFTGIALASAVFFGLDAAGIPPRGLLLLLAAATVPVTAYLFWSLPHFVVRFAAWLLVHTVYDVTIRGREHMPRRGSALLVANHVSYVDALLIGATMQRFVRFVMWRGFFDPPVLRPLMRLMRVIPIGAGPKDVVRAIREARAALEAGHVVCLFPEGGITRTGTMGRFRAGLERIAEGLDVPVIPVHLDGLWGSIFSFRGVWTGRLPFPVAVSFGAPVRPASAEACRLAVAVLGAGAMGERAAVRRSLGEAFLAAARRCRRRRAAADSLGRDLDYGRLAAAAEIVAGEARRWEEPMVGVALPASVGGCVANVGLALAGKVSVNLNVTAAAEDVAAAVRRCGLRRVLTSAKVLERLPGGAALFAGAEAVDVGALLEGASLAAKTGALLRARLGRAARVDPDAPATVVFSSGSTGEPKGVVLTHANLLANVEALKERFDIVAEDAVLGGLPLFHSFGLTVGMWFPLLSGLAALHAPSPLDARAIGRLAADRRGTILLATPSFLAAYMKRVPAEEFRTLRLANAGAEALRTDVAAAWGERYGVPIVQGYGATECGPVVSIDLVPPNGRPGTIGPALPGVAVRVGAEGVLEVRGPSVTPGYLGDAARTAEVLRDGWYRTGDVAVIDADGFIRLEGRLSRFAKVAGEMVPLGRVEEAVVRAAGIEAEAAGASVAAAAVADAARGERIVVLHAVDLDAGAIVEGLRAAGLPNLWIPRPGDFRRVEAIPLLGTGKRDLRRLRLLAESGED